MIVQEVGGGPVPAVPSSNAARSGATDAFGLGFDALLKIVLTQLTYQDPLKPMDNFQFVSQLAQFSQIQQSQQMVDSLDALLSAQTTGQAAALIGREVDVSTEQGAIAGRVIAAAFAGGNATITIESTEGQTISRLPLANISQIRETE